jgi:hypothetical protein
MSKTPAFLITLALLALVTGGIVFDLSRGADESGGFLHPPRRRPAASVEAPAIEPRPPIQITLDGVSLHPETPQPAGPARLVARTITFGLTTDKFHDIQDAIGKWVAAHHASIVGEEGLPGRVLMVTLTVPPDEAEAARVSVRTLGTVLRESAATEDLTDSHRTLLSRIEVARAEDRRLTELLARGGSIPDIAGVTRAQTFAHTEASRLAVEAAALAARAAAVTFVVKIEGR